MRKVSKGPIHSAVSVLGCAMVVALAGCGGGGGGGGTTADTTAPTISSTLPAAAAFRVAEGTDVTVVFSEPMDELTVDATTFTVRDGSAPVNGTVTYNAATHTATFRPSPALARFKSYSATVTTGATDAAGNALAAAYSWTFSTDAVAAGAIQGRELALDGAVTTLAGTSYATDGTGTVARFIVPKHLTRDSSGNLYIVDKCAIRKMDSAGAITTLVGKADSCTLVDGTGDQASFAMINGITTDSSNLYVTEQSHTVRRVTLTSPPVVSTLAGSAGNTGSANGAGVAARFNFPTGITHFNGTLYVADTGNHTIRSISNLSGSVAVDLVAGVTGSAGSSNVPTLFNSPQGIGTDGTYLYVADVNNNRIRKIEISTLITGTVAGDGTPTLGDNVNGLSAGLGQLGGLACNQGCTKLYLTTAKRIRELDLASTAVTTVAGSERGYVEGSAASAMFDSPLGLVSDGATLYIAEQEARTVRTLALADGQVATIAGVPHWTDGARQTAAFASPAGVATDGDNLYIADSFNNLIRKVVIATGEVTTFAGTHGYGGATDGPVGSALFNKPAAITSDGSALYIADSFAGKVRKIDLTNNEVSTLNGGNPIAASGALKGITTDGTSLYLTDSTAHVIYKLVLETQEVSTFAGTAGTAGAVNDRGTAATFRFPWGITTDGEALYVADGLNNMIRRISLPDADVTTFAGSGSAAEVDGTGTNASFSSVRGITTDGTHLYVGGLKTLRRVTIANANVESLAGDPVTAGDTDGTGAAARFRMAAGLTTDGDSLFVVDSASGTVRKVE